MKLAQEKNEDEKSETSKIQTGIHLDRAPRRDRDHRDPGRHAASCAEQCQAGGTESGLYHNVFRSLSQQDSSTIAMALPIRYDDAVSAIT